MPRQIQIRTDRHLYIHIIYMHREMLSECCGCSEGGFSTMRVQANAINFTSGWKHLNDGVC